MSQQLVAKPQGIISEPNKVGQYPPGAFAFASNCAIRSFGAVEQLPKWSTSYTLNGLGVGVTVAGGVYMLSEGNLTVVLGEFNSAGAWRVCYYWYNESTGTITASEIALGSPWTSYVTNDMRTAVLLMRNRLIIAGSVRSFAIDFIEDSSGALSAVRGPRNCGVYQPVITDRNFSLADDDVSGPLPANTHMTATAVLRQIHTDGYELLSPPAMLGDFANLSTTQAISSNSWSVRTTRPILSSEHEYKVDIYHTRSQSVGYDSINNKYLPIACGSSFYRSQTGDVNSATTTISDAVMGKALGEALLTNVAKDGATALPLPPVPSKTCAVFRGHAFYANRLDPATVTLLNPYFWGPIPSTAQQSIKAYGIGYRTWTGASASNGSVTASGLTGGAPFPSTDGISVGQNLYFFRTDTGAQVMAGQVVSKTASTVTSTVQSTYTGSVTVVAEDVIELNGVRYGVGTSAQEFADNVITAGFNTDGDITTIALEPQASIAVTSAYPSFTPTGGLRIRMRTNANITLRATNGGNFSPILPDIASTVLTIKPTPQPNGYAWSENNEPENCPPSNYEFAGQGDIHRVIATRDCLWFFCSDGLFRLSGAGGSVGEGYDWVLDPVDPTLVIMNPQAACVHREYVYAYTNRGFVSISSEGQVRELSDGRINPSSASTTGKLPNRTWTQIASNGTNDATVWLEADQSNDDVWIRTGAWETNAKQIWVYNTKTDTFCIRIPTLYSPREIPTAGVYHPKLQEMWTVFSGRQNIHVPSNVSNELEEAAIVFQPIFGSGATAPHTVKHWQDIQFSFKTPQPSSTCTITLRGTGASGVQTARVLPQVTGSPNGESARLSFVVSRNFPAMSNVFAFSLFIGAHSSDSPVTLEAFSVNYINFTTDRARR